MITIPEWHELFRIVFLVFLATLVLMGIFAKWLEFTYKKAHKKAKRVQRARRTTIVYDLGDTSKMTLYEIKQMRNLMERELRANVQ